MKQIQKVNKEDMRQNNALLVFETIYRNEGITRTQLAAQTKMSAMTVGRIVDFLLSHELLAERMSKKSSDIGRPASRLYLNHGIVSIGVSLDPSGIYIGLVDPYGNLLKFREYKIEPERLQPEELLEIVAEQIQEFITENALDGTQSVGIVVPALIDSKNQTVKISSQFKWIDVPVMEILGKYPHLPQILLDNDTKARAQAESRFRSVKKCDNLVLFNIGSGIGSGVIINNEIYRGKENFAGEIGHTMLSMNNRICECGRKGCIEATISLYSVLREARAIDPDIDLAGLERAYQENVAWARTLLNMTAENILMVINLLANAYAPDVIVLCGSLVDQCETLRKIIIEAHAERYLEVFNNNFELEFSQFGSNGNLIGAAALAFNHNIEQYIACSENS